MRISTFASSLVFAAAVLVSSWAESDENTWHSELCPADWTPEFTTPDGRFLHDFSYAGYRLGQEPPGLVGNTFDPVKLHKADPTGKTDAQPAIQDTIRSVQQAGGGTVALPAGIFRCDDILRISTSNVVLRGAAPRRTRLFFTFVPTRRQRDHILVARSGAVWEVIPLAADAANRQRYVEVVDARAMQLQPGQDIGVGWEITPEFVKEHHMTGTWKVFNGKWREFFQRTILRIDRQMTPHRVYLDVPMRYPVKLRDNAGICAMDGYVSECGVESLSVSNAVSWERAWSRAGVHAVGVEGAKDCWVRDVHSFASPLVEAQGYHLQGGGVYVGGSKRISVLDCRMDKAQNRGGGGAGYLFEISRSSEVLRATAQPSPGDTTSFRTGILGRVAWSGCVASVSREGALVTRVTGEATRGSANTTTRWPWRASSTPAHSTMAGSVGTDVIGAPVPGIP